MGDSTAQSPSTSQTGFAKSEVQQFTFLGQTQSADRFRTQERPKQRERVTTNIPLGSQKLVTGFLGEFSDITEDQVTALTKAFQRRESTIRQRLASPGRSQLTLAGV